MASPKFDALHVFLSRRIDDAVALAATDGDRISSAKRSQYLNEGIRNWMKKKFQSGDYSPLRGMVNQESKAMVGSVMTLGTSSGWTGGVAHIIDAVNTTPTTDVIVRPLPENLYNYSTLGLNKYFLSSSTNQFYVEDAGNFRLLGGAATDTIQLRYVKQHPDMTQAYATDISIDEQYYDEVLDEAERVYLLEYPSQDNTARLQLIGK